MTQERSVAVEVGLDEEEHPAGELEPKLDRLREAVTDRGGVPLRSPDSTRYGARFLVSADDPAAAVEDGVEAFKAAAATAGVPDAPIVEAEAKTLDELADERDDPEVPPLIDLAGVAQLLGVSQDLGAILTRFRDFPPPAAELSSGPIWTRHSIDRFLRRTEVTPAPSTGEDLPERARDALSRDDE